MDGAGKEEEESKFTNISLADDDEGKRYPVHSETCLAFLLFFLKW